MKMNAVPAAVVAIGDLSLLVNGHSITLKDVFYVPASSFNLISVSKMIDDGEAISVTHTKNSVYIATPTGQVMGQRRRGLYFVDVLHNGQQHGTPHDPVALVGTTQETEETEGTNDETPSALQLHEGRWAVREMQELHRKTHVGITALRAIARRDQKELKYSDKQLKEVLEVQAKEIKCDACMPAKCRRKHPRKAELPRRPARKGINEAAVVKMAAKPAEMSADVAGPNMPSLSGNRYTFVVVLGDTTEAKVGFGRKKSKIQDYIRDNYRLWCNDQKRKPVVLKCDRGELKSKRFQRWCRKKGIEMVFTAPNSSSGRAEKKIDTLESITRALINDCHGPGELWEEGMKYAKTITLFVPSSAEHMQGKSPWEMTHEGEKPRMHALHRFGCLAVAHVPATRRSRQENHGRVCCFVGLAENEQDGYRFYDEETKTIFTAKGAEFDETTSYFDWRRARKETINELKQRIRTSGAVPTIRASESEADDRKLLEALKVHNKFAPLDNVEEESEAEMENENDEQEEEQEEVAAADLHQRHSTRARTQRQTYDPNLWETQYDAEMKKANITVVSGGKDPSTVNKSATNKKSTIQLLNIVEARRSLRRTMERLDAQLSHGTKRLPAGEIPSNAQAALTSVEREKWFESMVKEMVSQTDNETLGVVRRSDFPLQKGVKARWVFDIKKKNGVITRYKARLVAKGYLQRLGLDYTEDKLFAPTPRIASVRLLVAIALNEEMDVWHNDVETAFLNSHLEENMLLEPPVGLELDEEYIYKLMRCIYGLKQASHEWHKNISGMLKRHNFVPADGDECVFIHRGADGKIDCILPVYVDDVLFAAKPAMADKVRSLLKRSYKMKDLGRLEWYLGISVEWSGDKKRCYLSQEAFINQLLEEWSMQDCNPAHTPALNKGPRKATEPISKEEEEWLRERDYTPTKYRSLIGAMNYLAVSTRPDISFAVGHAARFFEDARREHWIAAKRILRYLKGSRQLRLRFEKSRADPKLVQEAKNEIVGFCDSDWAGCLDTRTSTWGFVFLYGGGAITWRSKKDSAPARSSAEAEIVALDKAAREARWLRKLEQDFDLNDGSRPTTIHEDNSAAVSISAKNRASSERTKHIDVKYFAVYCKDVEDGRIKVSPIATADNVADIFTKGLERTKFEKFRDGLGLVEK